MSKTIVVILIGFLAIQVSHQSPVNDDDNIVSMLSTVYEKYLKLADSVIDSINVSLYMYEEDKQYFQDATLGELLPIFLDYNHQFVDILRELQAESDDDVQAFIQCLRNERASVDQAINKTFYDVADCGFSAFDEALPYLKDIMTNQMEVHQKVQDQIDNLKNCSASELECLVSFINEGYSALKYFEDFVSDNLASWTITFLRLFGDLLMCDTKTNVKANTKQILAETYTCIKNN
ncbi:uncharacterized protein LOC126741099 [Anthonomus grandis grandis]|uniref:uncharacterized protein LOC126741099 n=1 Tax=Anthonomus grandis grandis TaxID=2921223 RepID=UPI002166291C|nr:uncharacterized protein LOC126741099 [Anthonomus grandis grandis]